MPRSVIIESDSLRQVSLFNWLLHLLGRDTNPPKPISAGKPAGLVKSANLSAGQSAQTVRVSRPAQAYAPAAGLDSGATRRIVSSIQPVPGPQAKTTPAALNPVLSSERETHPNLQTRDQAKAYLERVKTKINSLAERFAAGNINRAQFQELYAHYQQEIQTIESILAVNPDSDEWKKAITEGQSILIRRRNRAAVLGFSIYDNGSGMPLRSLGQFGLDPALFVPMLSSYRSATKEIFGGGMRSTQIEDGKWLCFVPGKITTTMALFNMEPSSQQLKSLDELQQIFESANEQQLNSNSVQPDLLVCPHEFFIGHPL
jgi:hypothetical protein